MNEKPNLLFIFTDQQRYDTVGPYGNPNIKTPNLDKLAESSAVFKRAYVAQPVCTPARATIMTGLYPHNHGCVGNNIILGDDVPTIAEMVSGYKTAYMGKWHLGDEMIRQHGFDEWISTEEYRGYVSDPEYRTLNCKYYDYFRSEGFMPDQEGEDYQTISRDFATRVPEVHSKPAFTAREADRFMKENRDKPFMLYVNFLEPHPPFFSVFDDMYDPDEVDLPANFGVELTDDKPSGYHLVRMYAREIGRHVPLKDERTWRKLIAHYWGAVSLVDKYTGKILDSLRENGLEDNTIVVFTSDHGEMMGDFKMIQKGVIHDSSSRVPLFIKIPGVTDNQVRIEEPVGHVDLVPTLLDAMGLETDAALDGKSLLPSIKKAEELKDNEVFIEWNEGIQGGGGKWKKRYEKVPELADKVRKATKTASRTIVTQDGWKLAANIGGEHELYNYIDDPYERVNLYFDGNHDAIIRKLRGRIDAWQRTAGDTLELPSTPE